MEGVSYRPYRVVENAQVALNVYHLAVEGPTGMVACPGQFAQIKVDGFYLPRPLSICDWTPSKLIFLYKVVGQGTRALSLMRPGAHLDIMAGLGHGFDRNRAGDRPLLIGGGLGAAPLYGLARRLPGATVALGFQSAHDVILAGQLEALGAQVRVATVDGTMGHGGLVTDLVAHLQPTGVFACGPEPMLRAVHSMYPTGQFSFEARMACGIGACMGCTCKTKLGAKRVCLDGPVFGGEEILWC